MTLGIDRRQLLLTGTLWLGALFLDTIRQRSTTVAGRHGMNVMAGQNRFT